MNKSVVSKELAAAQSRVSKLHQQAEYALGRQTALLPEAIEELHTAVEELRVTEEEMRTQNEELMRARLRVEAERQRYQDLFEFAPDGYLITTLEGKILEANQASARLLNIAPRFLKNRPLAGSVYTEDLRTFHSRLTTLTQAHLTGRVQPEEWILRLRRRHTEPFYAALTVASVKASEDEPATLRWLVRDITERREAEEKRIALAQAQTAREQAETGQRRLSSFLDAITDTFITLDHEWRFTFLNARAAALCRAAGKDPETLIGQNVWNEFPTMLGNAFRAEAMRAVQTRETVEYMDDSLSLGCRLQIRVFPAESGVIAYAHEVAE